MTKGCTIQIDVARCNSIECTERNDCQRFVCICNHIKSTKNLFSGYPCKYRIPLEYE